MSTMMTSHATRPIGELLREWRERRRLSQLALALAADVSARHVSFLETGKSRPSREMLLHLMEQLDVPLRERNVMLLAAGFAPLFPERQWDDPALTAARGVVERVLAGHEPFPALAVDRAWTMVAANRAVGLLTEGIAPELLRPPVNVLRLSLHPEGLAPRIINLAEWRAHVLARLRRQSLQAAETRLEALLMELATLPVLPDAVPAERAAGDEILASVAVPLRLRSGGGTLSLLSTTMVFGTPLDVTLAELAIEAFFPADAATAAALMRGQDAGG